MTLIEKLKHLHNHTFVVGFDGFIDEIVMCVKTRKDAHHFEPIEHIADFAKRLSDASGKSCNIEFVTKQKKLGGNAPILANALVELGADVSLIGALGYPEVDPAFKDLVHRCHFHATIAANGHTDAVEFSDGKILLGKLSSIVEIDDALLLERVKKDTLTALLENCSLIASTNWTMISGMTKIWNMLYNDIFPTLSKKERWFFVDLADPAKRTDEDIQEALLTLKKLQNVVRVSLGLNLAESERIVKVLSLDLDPHEKSAKADVLERSISIQNHLGIDQVVIHARTFAVASAQKEQAAVDGPHVQKPILTTGGGDNFNAGYCLGIALGCSLEEALLLGTYTSGFYVRFGKSPSLEELISYLDTNE